MTMLVFGYLNMLCNSDYFFGQSDRSLDIKFIHFRITVSKACVLLANEFCSNDVQFSGIVNDGSD